MKFNWNHFINEISFRSFQNSRNQMFALMFPTAPSSSPSTSAIYWTLNRAFHYDPFPTTSKTLKQYNFQVAFPRSCRPHHQNAFCFAVSPMLGSAQHCAWKLVLSHSVSKRTVKLLTTWISTTGVKEKNMIPELGYNLSIERANAFSVGTLKNKKQNSPSRNRNSIKTLLKSCKRNFPSPKPRWDESQDRPGKLPERIIPCNAIWGPWFSRWMDRWMGARWRRAHSTTDARKEKHSFKSIFRCSSMSICQGEGKKWARKYTFKLQSVDNIFPRQHHRHRHRQRFPLHQSV